MTMRIVTRAEWGARPPTGTPTIVPPSARTATCVHHDGATPVIVTSFAQACAKVRADQDYHMDSNGWADIGYNYLVVSAPGYPAIDGLIFEGRRRDVVGAHCLNHNTEWIGVQVATGGDQVHGDQTPSPTALASVRWLHDGFVVAAQHALGKVGHKDGFATYCPGPLLYSWVHAGMPVTTTPTGDAPMSAAEVATILAALASHEKNELGRYGSDGDRYADLVRREAAQTAALTTTIQALAAGRPGVDPVALLAAVNAAVKAALAGLSVTVKVP